MALTAQKIQGFSKDFNAPVRDFISSREVGVFGTPSLSLDDLLDTSDDLINKTRNNVIESLSGVKDFMDDITRQAKDQFDKIIDLAQLTESKISEIIDDVFSGFPQSIINAVKSVGSVCRNNAIGNGMSSGGNLINNPNCAGFGIGNANCPPGATQGLLGNIGTEISRGLKRGLDAIRKGVQVIASLLGMGYNANLCNVLTSVLDATGIGDKSIISVAVASVLGKEGLRGNVNALVDVAKSNVGNLAKMVPGLVKTTAGNMKLGNTVNLTNIKHAGASILGSFSAVDKNWNVGKTGLISTAGVAMNTGLKMLTDNQRKTSTFSSASLNSASLSRDEQFYAANTSTRTQTLDSLLA